MGSLACSQSSLLGVGSVNVGQITVRVLVADPFAAVEPAGFPPPCFLEQVVDDHPEQGQQAVVWLPASSQVVAVIAA